MNKMELAKEVAVRTGLTKEQAGDAVEAFTLFITETLAAGGSVRVPGLGIFECHKRPAKAGRNPRTQEPITIPERVVPCFRPGQRLKTAAQGQ